MPNRQSWSVARGFTFVEILAAMLFMAIVIPVTVQGLMVANRAGILAERKRVAAQLADKTLTEMVLTSQWQAGDQSGDYGDDAPDYHWNLTSEQWSEDSMTLVSVVVRFKVQAQDCQVRLSTLVTAGNS